MIPPSMNAHMQPLFVTYSKDEVHSGKAYH